VTTEPYSERVRQLFAEPEHAGVVEGGSRIRVDDQGVRIEFSARCADGVVTELAFRAWGCPHVLAAAEAICRDFEGRSCAALETFEAGQLMRSLPVPRDKLGRILVLEDAVRSLGQSVRRGPDPGEDKT